MMNKELLSRPRIIAANAYKYIGRNVTFIGEVTSITPHANTLTLTLPDGDNLIVLLQRNSTTIEPNLLTEVTGKLVSRGQIESSYIKQYDQKETALFSKGYYVEMAQILDAQRAHYDL